MPGRFRDPDQTDKDIILEAALAYAAYLENRGYTDNSFADQEAADIRNAVNRFESDN